MNYVFFGSPEFAAIILERLIEAGIPPRAVVCNPDRPVGRRQILTAPPAKAIAQKHGVRVWQPERLETGNGKWEIGNADFAVVAAYAKILPREIIELPRLGTIGIHPSLLPKYRGATPIQSAILDGETETGVALFLLDEKVDHGAIIAASRVPLAANDTYETALKKLAELGARLLIETIPKFVSGAMKPTPQNESYATYTKKFTTKDGAVDMTKDAPELIWRKIRALHPEPGVYTLNFPGREGVRVKLREAEFSERKLIIKIIQPEGKKPVSCSFAMTP